MPAPQLTGVGVPVDGAWWADTVVAHGKYFAPYEASNVAFIYDRATRSTFTGGIVQGTSPGREYATEVHYRVPGDARGGVLTVQSNGIGASEQNPLLRLVAPDISFSSLWGISWAPSTGKAWVAGDSQIDEIDIFSYDPGRTEPTPPPDPLPARRVTVVPSVSQPRISRPTADGRILFVESVSGVLSIQQINVNTRAISKYADTHDTGFTRQILPVGIAVAPDGSACYVADASTGRLVKIPYDNNAPIEDEWGTKTDWVFSNPCGMDASSWGAVYASDAPGGVWQAVWWETVRLGFVGAPVLSLQIDQEISTDGVVDRFFMSFQPGLSEVFNLNPIGYGWDGSEVDDEVDPRYLGGFLEAGSDGSIELWHQSFYGLDHHKPQRVLVSNVDSDSPWLSSYQEVDRVVEFSLPNEWAPFPAPLRLRLIDPPDLAPYDDKNLDDPAGFLPSAMFPYEANDNNASIDDCVSAGECGLSVNPDGSSATRELIVTPPEPFYLKIPDDFSGENFQIEVSKVDPATSTPVPNRVLALGPVFTSWKRVFVERDKMFRKGGLLARDFDPTTCGAGGVEPGCDEVIVFDWVDVSPGDEIVLFQSDRSIDSSDALPATVTQVSPTGQPYSNSRRVTLDKDLGGAGLVWEASSDQPASVGGTASITFGVGESAGIGVVSGCDSSSNQINGSNSCFLEGDLRGVLESYADAFVDFRGYLDGADGVPYLYYYWVVTASPQDFLDFSSIWFQGSGNNKIQLIGASKDQVDDQVTFYGWSDIGGNVTYVFRKSCEARGRVEGKSVAEVHSFTRDTTVHEFAHQWNTNCCSSNGHDTRDSWCINELFCQDEGCVMHQGYQAFSWDDVVRFCTEDLLLGDPLCGTSSCMKSQTDQCPIAESALRTATDPI